MASQNDVLLTWKTVSVASCSKLTRSYDLDTPVSFLNLIKRQHEYLFTIDKHLFDGNGYDRSNVTLTRHAT